MIYLNNYFFMYILKIYGKIKNVFNFFYQFVLFILILNNNVEQFKLTNIMDRRSGLHLDRPQNYTIVKMQGTVEFVFYAMSIPNPNNTPNFM